MEIEVRWEDDKRLHRETFLLWDFNPPEWKCNPGRKPTDEEARACPKIFTCYCCSEKHSADELGGTYHDKRFCFLCIPFIDEWVAGAMIRWEDRRKKHPNATTKPTVSLGEAERLAGIMRAVRWGLAHGYPIQK